VPTNDVLPVLAIPFRAANPASVQSRAVAVRFLDDQETERLIPGADRVEVQAPVLHLTDRDAHLIAPPPLPPAQRAERSSHAYKQSPRSAPESQSGTRRPLRSSQRHWRRFCASSNLFSASPAASFAALACDADCHSRSTSSAAAPKIKTKKNSSLRTMGPISAISCLLAGNQRASLSSCKPSAPAEMPRASG